MDFGSVQSSEAFAGCSKLLPLFPASPASSRTCLRNSIDCRFARDFEIFLMDGFAFKIHGMQSVEGLVVEISLVRHLGDTWNSPDGSADMNQAIERSGGIEGGSK